MYDLSTRLAVQSYCFRHFKTLPELIAQIHAVGLTRTELCGVHADFNDASAHPGVIDQFRSAGIAIASIGVQTFRGDPNEEKWFAFAKAAGASMIAATFDLGAIPAVFDHAAKLADQYDLTLGIHNHGGYDWLGNFPMLAHLFKNLSPRIGLCLDTAWCLHAAGDPVQWAEKFHDKLFGIHIKDFSFNRAGRWEDEIVGTGNLKLREFLATALTAPRLTAVTLEYEGDIINPRPKLKECLTAIRRDAPAH